MRKILLGCKWCFSYVHNFLANTGHTPRVSNTSPTAAPQPYGCSPFFFFFFLGWLPPLYAGCVCELIGCVTCWCKDV